MKNFAKIRRISNPIPHSPADFRPRFDRKLTSNWLLIGFFWGDYIDDLLNRSLADGKKFDQTKLCTVYKNIMVEEAEFYDNMSVKALGRSVKHIMLLHETDLNALCIADLVSALRTKGWNIISPELAYTDPIAEQEPSAAGKLNQGRVFALAKELGYKGPYWSKWNEEEEIDKEFTRQKVWK